MFEDGNISPQKNVYCKLFIQFTHLQRKHGYRQTKISRLQPSIPASVKKPDNTQRS